MTLNESTVEDAALEWVGKLGYAVGHGPHLAPGEPAAERDSFGEVVLAERLRAALRRLNGAIPEEAREEALRKVLRWHHPRTGGFASAGPERITVSTRQGQCFEVCGTPPALCFPSRAARSIVHPV